MVKVCGLGNDKSTLFFYYQSVSFSLVQVKLNFFVAKHL